RADDGVGTPRYPWRKRRARISTNLVRIITRHPFPSPVAAMLCCAAAQSILDHPSAGGIYAASDPPPVTNFTRRHCIDGNSVRVRRFLVQFAVVPTIDRTFDAGSSARSRAAAPAADERSEAAQWKLDGHLSGWSASSGNQSRPDATRPKLRRDSH